jgi:succinate-semialdehyde dehydrogenase / glutarate-semialdehyde dehydrogenase
MSTTLIDTAARPYRTVNPATGEVVREYETITDEQAEQILARAHAAFSPWRETPVAERARLCLRLADVFDENADELSRRTTLEMGKPLAQSHFEVPMASAVFRYYGTHGEELLADEVTEVPGFSRVVTRREAVGVALGIAPWNGPMYTAMRATAPNVMLGNTMLLKPSELSAGSSLFFEYLFDQAGFPEGVYQTALVSFDQVSSYIADPRVRAVTLTGSARAGSAVGEQAGRHIKPVVLELGGSDAFIVLDSADVAKAAATASACRLMIGGQVCCSPKRLIVTEAVADEFTEQFIAAFEGQVVGDPFDPATTVGPLSSQAAADTLQQQYQDAIDNGATVLLAGGRVDGPGAFFAPAVITDITPEMRVYSEEAFGPLAMIYRVPDADAAVELANSSRYGLGGTVFAADPEEAQRVARALDTGGVGINTFLGGPVEVPFGGTKRSGVGREQGRTGMDQFANIKTYGSMS